ncbi:MAG: hypothetical protein AAF460_08815 [Pseudomonadota bacterium]
MFEQFVQTQFETTRVAAATIAAGTDMNSDLVPNLDQVRAEAGWAFTANSFTFTGSPDRIRFSIQVHQVIANNVNRQRACPVLHLRRNGTIVATSASGYIRDATDHEESSASISFLDVTPGTNPVYDFLTETESNQTGNVPVETSSIGAEAIVRTTPRLFL